LLAFTAPILTIVQLKDANTTLAQPVDQSKDISTVSSDLSKLREQLEEAHGEIAIKTAQVAFYKAHKERAEVESKKMRERLRKQVSEKDEMIKGMRESNSKLTGELALPGLSSSSHSPHLRL